MMLKFIEQSGTKGIAQVGIIEMFYIAPGTVIRETAFGNQAMNVGIPFQRTTKGVKYTDESGSEVFGFVHLKEHAQNNRTDRVEQTVQ